MNTIDFKMWNVFKIIELWPNIFSLETVIHIEIELVTYTWNDGIRYTKYTSHKTHCSETDVWKLYSIDILLRCSIIYRNKRVENDRGINNKVYSIVVPFLKYFELIYFHCECVCGFIFVTHLCQWWCAYITRLWFQFIII